MKYVHTFGTGRHKRQADITLLFQYSFTLLLLVILFILMNTCYTALPQTMISQAMYESSKEKFIVKMMPKYNVLRGLNQKIDDVTMFYT